MTCDEKEEIFLSEPIGEKPAHSLPGINKKVAQNLRTDDFVFAYQILGQYLLLKEDELLFVEWIEEFGASETDAKRCHNCLTMYRSQFV